jgi:hypothetical protein
VGLVRKETTIQNIDNQLGKCVLSSGENTFILVNALQTANVICSITYNSKVSNSFSIPFLNSMGKLKVECQ